MSSKQTMKSVFESLLYVFGEPLDVKRAAELFQIEWQEAEELFHELQDEYEKRGSGITLREIDGCFQFCTRAENSEYIERFFTPIKEKRLSQSAMEVLAIVAYKQPVTKGEMEAIRGIKCDRVIEGLMRKGLLEEAGRSTGIGRPILYATTALFLKHFGFENLKELPEIEDITGVIREEDDAEIDAILAQQVKLEM